ncbi:MAG TPA: hypothetical protein VFT90_01690 [Chryseosolibacter sp.]|nr:hypothetical protein [Chryseosolibacter sp.]
MKTLLLVVALYFLIFPNMFGEIRNGYERDIAFLKVSLQGLKDLLAGDQKLSIAERLKIKQKINSIHRHLTYHEITETLLQRFNLIAPHLYEEIDNLKDGKGRSVDVYVKFLPLDAPMESTGMVSLRPSGDSTACSSEHGMATASVRIRITNKALKVLAHEFGHLSYIIPNLRSYIGRYSSIYRQRDTIAQLGHLQSDPSGESAFDFEKRFSRAFASYRKENVQKDLSPMQLVARTHRSVLNGEPETGEEVAVVRMGVL